MEHMLHYCVADLCCSLWSCCVHARVSIYMYICIHAEPICGITVHAATCGCLCVCVCACMRGVLIARVCALVSLYVYTSCLFVNFLSCLQGIAVQDAMSMPTTYMELWDWKFTTRSICDGVPSWGTGGVYICTNALNITNGPATGLYIYIYISSCTCCLKVHCAQVWLVFYNLYCCSTHVPLQTKHLCILHCP